MDKRKQEVAAKLSAVYQKVFDIPDKRVNSWLVAQEVENAFIELFKATEPSFDVEHFKRLVKIHFDDPKLEGKPL